MRVLLYHRYPPRNLVEAVAVGQQQPEQEAAAGALSFIIDKKSLKNNEMPWRATAVITRNHTSYKWTLHYSNDTYVHVYVYVHVCVCPWTKLPPDNVREESGTEIPYFFSASIIIKLYVRYEWTTYYDRTDECGAKELLRHEIIDFPLLPRRKSNCKVIFTANLIIVCVPVCVYTHSKISREC